MRKRDTRRQRAMLAKLLVAGLAAVAAEYYLAPVITRKLGV